MKELPAETEPPGVGSDEEGRGNSCFSEEKSKTRYPRRCSRRKVFYEENITKDDDFMYCAGCDEEKEGECPYHPLFLILDNPVVRDGSEKDRARLTTPWPLTVYDSKVKGAGKGVWTNAHLPANLVFGPYEGRVLSGPPEAGKESGYGWKIRGAGTRNRCIDAVDIAVSNWMRYVNCSRTQAETNLSAFQYKGQVYYRTDSAIRRGSELMCWYGADYGKDLGLSREPSKWKPAKKDVKDRQCEWCGLVYSSKDYLTLHLKVSRKSVRTYTPPICSTRGSSSNSGSTKQCLREEAPQFPEKAPHESLRPPALFEFTPVLWIVMGVMASILLLVAVLMLVMKFRKPSPAGQEGRTRPGQDEAKVDLDNKPLNVGSVLRARARSEGAGGAGGGDGGEDNDPDLIPHKADIMAYPPYESLEGGPAVSSSQFSSAFEMVPTARSLPLQVSPRPSRWFLLQFGLILLALSS
ncbi:putative histone-lysine N-methyltransferase PRDM7 [Penaeus vannamei]|uniref:Putative histone-lysine N-methyltransferase PRDM7 n=1 Tax=Penaeus vannamei TaxID=6689 RepID=A0A423U7F6_PENVA|nr:putative histone-lysine N-methyltransferase PRDM7 [Penaeus vannamei]